MSVHSELPSAHQPPVILLKQDASLVLITLASFPPVINPSASSCPSARSLSVFFLSLLPASRFSASFQAGFKQLCGTSKCPSLCRLFRKADNDKPNPADLQLIALFRQPSTVILRPQTPPLPHLWLRRFDRRLPMFLQQGHRFSIINAYFHLCHGCVATQCLQSLRQPSPVSHLLSWLLLSAQFVDWSQETSAPCQMPMKGHGGAP